MAKENREGQEKTEKPTTRRKNKSRKEGSVARSQDLNSAVVMIAGFTGLVLAGGWMFNRIMNLTREVYLHLDEFMIDNSTMQGHLSNVLSWLITTLTPVMLVIIITGIAINLIQFGFLWTTKPLQPKLSKLDPTKGLKNIFNQKSFVRLLQNIAKLFFIGFIAYSVVRSEWHNFVPLMDSSVGQIYLFLVRTILKVAVWTLSALLILGIIDFVYQKYKHLEELKMSKQEVKDEHKMIEGDPKVKARIRQTQFQLAFNAMIKQLPKADVVITNPIHVAVALNYEPEEMNAPKVIGKGLRKLAERIKSIARENDIPIVENPPLARGLYNACDLGDEIPGQFYQDVAEILSRIYHLQNDLA